MPRGRPPKPTATKKEQGTLRKDRERGKAPEPDPMQTAPPAPAGLSDRGRKLWARYAEVLVRRRLLAEDGGDLLALESMVREWDRYLDLLEEVYYGDEPEGVNLSKVDGSLYRNPKDVALNAALANATRLMLEFGLSPSSRVRARSAAAPAPKPHDPYSEFRGGRVIPGQFGGGGQA